MFVFTLEKSREFKAFRYWLLYKMSDTGSPNKEESNLDFTEDVQKTEEQITMEDLDKKRESIDKQGEEEMQRLKKLAADVVKAFFMTSRMMEKSALP